VYPVFPWFPVEPLAPVLPVFPVLPVLPRSPGGPIGPVQAAKLMAELINSALSVVFMVFLLVNTRPKSRMSETDPATGYGLFAGTHSSELPDIVVNSKRLRFSQVFASAQTARTRTGFHTDSIHGLIQHALFN
jgi:hypothetical protein